MKPITINVQISKCPKQYESVRLGGEWTVDEGETAEQVMAAALAELNKFYAESQAPKPKADPAPATPAAAAAAAAPAPAADKKKPLSFGKDTKTIQAICKRIEAGTPLDKVLEFYEPDEQTMAVLKLAADFNK